MNIAIASDHAGFDLKAHVGRFIESLGHEVIDCGTESDESCDYPDYGRAAAIKVITGEAERAVLVCGSGVGIMVAANKVRGIVAGTCHDTFSARQGVEDDAMNVLCLGARVIGTAVAEECIRAFLSARFSEAERHARRLNKVREIERETREGVFDREVS